MSVPLVYHPSYSFPFPGRHRFPMEKFRLLHERLRDGGVAGAANLHRPGRARPALLSLAHCPEYLDRFLGNRLGEREAKRMGLPWSEDLVRRTCIAPMGTLLTAQLALKHGIACHLAGGTHHAHYDFGSGFCILNDLAITARALRAGGLVKRVLIFDCDVHQGDGTAQIINQQSHKNIITCSIHCEQNFPRLKQQSDYDFSLPAKSGDDEYIDTLQHALALCVSIHQPDIILYNAGADIYTKDELGLLNVSITGVYERDLFVLDFCKQHNIPLMCGLGGGYQRNLDSLINVHKQLFKAAIDL